MEDIKRICAYLERFVGPTDVTELRAFGQQNFSGFFDGKHLESMARAATELEKTCRGVYFIPNPVKQELLAISPNQVRLAGQCTTDADIIERRWLLIDIDPVRPANTSATNEERKEAWQVLLHVQTGLEAVGFSDPIVACSGNGWHLSYPIRLPNDEESRDRVKSILNGLDKRCSSAGAKVDIRTYNASRIWKLYGTRARKGESTEERPHRLAWITSAPDAKVSSKTISKNSDSTSKVLMVWKNQDDALSVLENQRTHSDAVSRAVEYLSKMAPAISGQGGHSRTYHAAMVTVEGFALSEQDAIDALADWNSKCVPPWDTKELLHKVRDAAKNCINRGHLLNANQPVTGKQSFKSGQWAGPDALPDVQMSEDDPDATACDLIAHQATIQWCWPGWIQKGTITALASDPGCGKTRFCADLARRIYLGLPWPDGTPATLPAKSKVLWIAADSQWSELGTLPSDFGFAPEALVLNGRRSNPYAGTNLDSLEDLAEFMARIRRVNPGLVFVDTCGSATDKNTTRPEEAKGFFKPLAEIATKTGTSIVLVTHLNKGGEALGRRIVGACRQVIKLEHPDPEGQPNRRKLWVDKTNSKKPEVLGVTMGDSGNDYDLNPPSPAGEAGESKPSASKRGRPSHLEEDKQWLKNYMSGGAQRVSTAIRDAEFEGISINRLYRAKESVGVIQYEVDGKKYWKSPELENPFDD